MSDDENNGYLSLGTEGAGGAAFPPTGAEGKIHVSPKGGNKLQKSGAVGKNGAKTGVNGTKVAEFLVKYSYPDRLPHRTLWEAALAVISPYNGKQGAASGADAFDLSHRFAAMYGATAALVDEIDGPTPKDGSDEMTGSIKLSIWTKPTNSGAGVASVPVAPVPWQVAAQADALASTTVFQGPNGAFRTASGQGFSSGKPGSGEALDAFGNPILPSYPSVDP